MPLPLSQTVQIVKYYFIILQRLKKNTFTEKKTKTCKNDFELPEDKSYL